MKNLGIIFKIFFTFIILAVFSFVKAASIPVENVFSDITPDYKYYHELQTLYDKGMIFSSKDGKFNPNSYLTRAEFVAIASEVSCKRCVQPYTDLYYLDKYKKPPFFDVLPNNKYFYCIADAKANNYVAGYDINYKCDDGTYKQGDKPFCLNNTITREEALAVILRMGNILTASQAEAMRKDIKNNRNEYKKLALDVKPILDDGNVYSFYPDFLIGLDYKIYELDENGNEKILTLIDKIGDYLYPKRPITKEDFLRMAYVALKINNNCIDLVDNNLAVKMQIFEKTCSEDKLNICKLSDLVDPENVFDFNGIIKGACEKGVNPVDGYIWRFYHTFTGEQIIKKGKYIDNYKFLKSGKRLVFFRGVDNCGNTAEVHNTIVINNNNFLDVSIDANPIIGPGPLKVDLKGIVNGSRGPFIYNWEFGDGEEGVGQNLKHIFKYKGVYEVLLTVTDKDGRKGDATVIIKVTNDIDCSKDQDKDGVDDCIDKCPLVYGDKNNSGCPVFDKYCDSNCGCPDGYVCGDKNPKTCSSNVCIPSFEDNILNTLSDCELQRLDLYTGITFGTLVCNTCPCSNNLFLDFISKLRYCDLVFPAITSPDEKNIYSKGELFQIEKK